MLRDPRSSEFLLVTDWLNEVVCILHSADAETPGFDVLTWYKQEGKLEQYRHILIDDTDFTSPPQLFRSLEAQA